MDHKTSHKDNFLLNEIYTSSGRWINNISIEVWFMIGQYFGWYTTIWKSEDAKKCNIEKIIFKVVQMKFLAMHINNQILQNIS